MKIFTIGFTQKTAAEFFTLLKEAGVKKLVDIRINNVSQLAGFAKGKDLEFFTNQILDIPYEYVVNYAPTKKLLKSYRDGMINWEEYEKEYLRILDERNILKNLVIQSLEGACLLCSEHLPDQCHRRLLAEYIQTKYPQVEIIHLS